ncbi:MAG: hypothetical protein JNN11_02995 [Candidatus Doudnabacteria bacterium]|nr:hypothetical protein [Candidatus Doudnabacteria bacterium]
MELGIKNLYTKSELEVFKRLSTPQKIQDYLNSLKFNFEKGGETCMSPRFVMQTKKAHCMEGAMFAAAALEFCGHKPLVMDLRANKDDFDHVVCVFEKYGSLGALSKTNHAVLRYREPIYKNIRELALSFFHEYFDERGRKNLREYSSLCDLRTFNFLDWRTTEKNLFAVPKALDKIKHFKILSKEQVKNLRLADRVEIQAGKIVEYK